MATMVPLFLVALLWAVSLFLFQQMPNQTIYHQTKVIILVRSFGRVLFHS